MKKVPQSPPTYAPSISSSKAKCQGAMAPLLIGLIVLTSGMLGVFAGSDPGTKIKIELRRPDGLLFKGEATYRIFPTTKGVRPIKSGNITFESGYFEGDIPLQGGILLDPDGFAPVSLGPSGRSPTKNTHSLALSEGVARWIHCVDKTGQKLVGATVKGFLTDSQDGSSFLWFEKKTDTEGRLHLEGAPGRALLLEAIAVDHFKTSGVFDLSSSQEQTLILKTTCRTSLKVVDKSTGLPLVGAEVRIFGVRRGPEVFGNLRTPGGFTDAHGVYTWEELDPTTDEYFAGVSMAGYGPEYAWHLKPGSGPVQIELGSSRILRGTVTGDIDRLGMHNNQRFLIFSQDLPSVPNISLGLPQHSGTISLYREGNATHFEMRDLWPGLLMISWEDNISSPDLETVRNRAPVSIPIENGVQDIRLRFPEDFSLKRRAVILTFRRPDGKILEEGSILVRTDINTPGGIEHKRSRNDFHLKYQWGDLKLEKGEATFEVAVPFTFDLSPLAIPGFHFSNPGPITVSAGEEPFQLDVLLQETGTVKTNFKPVNPKQGKAYFALFSVNASGSLQAAWLPLRPRPESVYPHRAKLDVPFGGKHRVAVHFKGVTFFSKPFTVSPGKPEVEVDVHGNHLADIRGRLVTTDGRPIPQVKLKIFTSHPIHATSIIRTTDERGYFDVTIDPSLEDAYYLQFAQPWTLLQRGLVPTGTPMLSTAGKFTYVVERFSSGEKQIPVFVKSNQRYPLGLEAFGFIQEMENVFELKLTTINLDHDRNSKGPIKLISLEVALTHEKEPETVVEMPLDKILKPTEKLMLPHLTASFPFGNIYGRGGFTLEVIYEEMGGSNGRGTVEAKASAVLGNYPRP